VGDLSVSQPYSATSTNTSTTQLYANYAVALSAPIFDTDNTSCSVNPPQQVSVQWSFTSVPAGSRATLRNASSLNPTFTPDLMVSSWTLQAVATDSTGRSTTRQYTVSTNGCGGNSPAALVGLLAPVTVPPVSSTTAATVITGTVVQLDGSKSNDADNGPSCNLGQTLSYRWSFTQLPAGSVVTLNSAALANPSFTPDVDGTYVLSLLVSDNLGFVSAPVGTVTVTATAQGNVAAQGVGPYSVVATDANGVPSMLIYDNTSGNLTFIRCTANCTSAAPTWSPSVSVDVGLGTLSNPGGNEPRPIDLKISSNGSIYAAYHFLNGSTCGVKVAASPNGTNWAKTTLDSVGNCNANGNGANESGRWLSLALKPGSSPVPAVAYYRSVAAANTVRYALCTDTAANCLSSPTGATYTQVDVQNAALASAGTQGQWPSLHFTSTGLPRVAYYVTGANRNMLAYAECNSNCASAAWISGNSNPIVDDGSSSANDVGRYASLDLVSTPGPTLDQPRIAYREETNALLKYASCASSCTGGIANWSRQVVDSSGDAGRFSSLALSPATGDARIAYYDVANRALRYASQSNLSGFRTSVLDNSSPNVGLHVSLGVTPQGNPRISYFDAINGNVKYLGFGP
jgi:hypothetical protein